MVVSAYGAPGSLEARGKLPGVGQVDRNRAAAGSCEVFSTYFLSWLIFLRAH